MPAVLRDVRHAVRSLERAPALAALAVTMLAIGIGAAATMFSVVDAALFRALPFDEPDRLAMIFGTRKAAGEDLQRMRWSWPQVTALQSSLTSFESVAAYSGGVSVAIAGRGDPEQIDGEVVSSAYFAAMRAKPVSGRVFSAGDDVAGVSPAAVVSDRLWRRLAAGQPWLDGSTLRVNSVVVPVIGVLPPGFAGLSGKADVWITPAIAAQLTYADYLTTPQRFIPVVGRLRPGVSIEAANAELATVGARIAGGPADTSTTWEAVAVPLAEVRIDPVMRRSALLLTGAATCVLLIGCVNVASLLLARARTRRREMAIRVAIGSSRLQLVRLLLTEGFLLASAAAIVGVGLATWGIRFFGRSSDVLAAIASRNATVMSAFARPELDLRVFAFIIGVTVATTIACALAPAVEGSRLFPAGTLKEDDRGGRSARGLPALVVAEVTLAVFLLAGAGLLIDGVLRVERMRSGFVPDDVLTFWIRPPTSRYVYPDDGPAIIERLLTRIQAVPGVESAAVNRCAPFTGCSRTTLFLSNESRNASQAPVVGRHYVSADYFKTLGIPVIAGRTLTDADRVGAPLVAVVNAGGARRLWRDENPIGQHVWFGNTTGPFADPAHAVTIVGVVGDVKYESIDQSDTTARAEFYTSYRQFSYPDSMFVVRARAGAASLIPALRQAVASVDASLPIYDVLTLNDRIDAAVSRPRVSAALLTVCGAVALLLAALGVYGVLSYSVSSRMREMGVRLALGADGGALQRHIVGHGVRLAAIGGALGILTALVVNRLLENVVVDNGPISMPILAGAGLTMLAVAAAAAFLPARRASRIDPWRVLRD